jgi:alpha-tubulin suppressor-like RCC1 family protein/uncharacterized protein YjbI with pentapeptide repeats
MSLISLLSLVYFPCSNHAATTVAGGPAGLSNAVAIAAGDEHGLALTSDGAVVAWGANIDSSCPYYIGQAVVPPDLTNVIAIAAGSYFSLALKGDGTVTGWGATPVPAGMSNIIAIAAGGSRSLALRNNGTLAGWGYYEDPCTYYYGQPGAPADASNVVAIAMGGHNCLALRKDGTMLGLQGTAVPAGLSDIVAISAGELHCLALKIDGTVVAWGNNYFGETVPPAGLSNVVAIAAGWETSMAIRSDGTAVTWGYGGAGGTNGMNNVVAISASAGMFHELWLLNDGAPYIARQPLNRATYSGMNTFLSVGVVGTPPLSLQWQCNGTNCATTTDGVLRLTNVQPANAGNYIVTVSSARGTVTSSSAMLEVLQSPPIINSQPAGQVVAAGSNVVLAVTAAGSWPLSYQWQLNGTNLTGATDAVLALNGIQLGQAGTYSIVVSNAFGVITCSNLLGVVPILITAQPQDQSRFVRATASFSVGATGLAPLSYQWQFNGTNLAGATNSSLVLTNIQLNQAGAYAVVLSNTAGVVRSANAILSVGQVFAWGDNSRGETNVPPTATNVIALAGGDYHCLALRTDGSVVVWGDNTYGQTNVPPNATNLTAIVSGSLHSLGLKADGTVVAWGYNDTGVTNVPPAATNVAALAPGPGARHALALRADGSLVRWGDTSYGLANIPATATNVVSVAVGAGHCLVLRGDGTVVAWGYNSSGQTNVPANATNIVAIAAGRYNSLALRADSTLLAWGSLGNTYPAPTNVVAIDCGGGHNLALRTNGALVAFGDNMYGQSTVPATATNLAAVAGTSYDSLAFVGTGAPVLTSPLVNRTAVSGGTAYFRAAAVGARPLSYQWRFNGTNLPGATNTVLGLASVQPSQAGLYSVTVSNALGTVTSSDAALGVVPVVFAVQPRSQPAYLGATVTLSVTASGQGPLAYQWLFNGTNLAGATSSSLVLTNVQLADAGAYSVLVTNVFGAAASSTAILTVVPILITLQPQTQAIYQGGTVTLSILAQANWPLTYQWQFSGTNLAGATANTLTLTNVQYSQTGTYTVFLSDGLATTNGTDAVLGVVPIAAWGQSSSGQTTVPVGVADVVAVAGGAYHSLALKANGTVVAWGRNSSGQTNVSAGLTNVVAVACGGFHSLALKSDGTAVAWGLNSYGQTNVPAGLTGVVAVAGGCYHSLALKSDGTVAAWGYGNYGQTNVPPGLSNVVAVAGGSFSSLALKADGTVAAWGNNNDGETNVPPGLTNVIAIAAGGYHCLALKADGNVVTWGLSSYGLSSVPTSLTNTVAISAGQFHSLAFKADGTIVAWGYSYDGETTLPSPLTNVVAIAAAECGYHNLALIGDSFPVVPLALTNPTASANGFSVCLPTQSGHVYRLEYKDSLTDGTWKAMLLAAGNARMLTLSDPAAMGRQRFYRARQW